MGDGSPPAIGSLFPRARVWGGGHWGGERAAGTCGASWRDLWVGLCSSPPCAGIQRFCRDIHMMLGFKPGLYFRACWLFLTPATLLVTGVGGRTAGWGPGLRAGPRWAFCLVGLSGGLGTNSRSTLLPRDAPSLCVCVGPSPQFGWQNECGFLGPLGLTLGLEALLSQPVGGSRSGIDHLNN